MLARAGTWLLNKDQNTVTEAWRIKDNAVLTLRSAPYRDAIFAVAGGDTLNWHCVAHCMFWKAHCP